MKYNEYLDKIYQTNEEWNELISSYWHDFSSFDAWQFWMVFLILILPLLLLIMIVDRKRLFELFFFGYTVHILWTYAANFLESHNYLVHNYFLTPFLPTSLNMTASALPVGFLLVYQYCTNRQKNFYIYAVILSAVFGIGFATVSDWIDLINFNKGMNQIYLFMIDVVIAFTAYWFTRLVKRVWKKAGGRSVY
ncbi:MULTISPECIES: hypothetical protein [Bacillaceae]|uniref:Uncharacterized protein n=1 Tax=Evansella alkalicola TaxID=745819 RepID=A0ABS6JXT0_9BACI|nr:MULTISPECIES: hypothetical protein [Bacillaceae]MBU9723303.1 hypothetical protein [Bacillus alkalicola]